MNGVEQMQLPDPDPYPDILRIALRSRANDIQSVARVDLAHAVTLRRRRSLMSLAGGCVAATLVGALTILLVQDPNDSPPTVLNGDPLIGAVHLPPPGSRLVSSRGLELTAPDNWEINNSGCNQSDAPTVVRGRIITGDCLTPEPATQDIVLIGLREMEWLPIQLVEPYVDQFDPQFVRPELALEPTQVDGHDVLAGSATLPDGRVAHVIRFVDRDLAVVIRSASAEIADALLASIRIRPIDSAGCPEFRPAVLAEVAGSSTDPLPLLDSATDVTLCYYPNDDPAGLLGSSTHLTSADLKAVIDAVRTLTFDTLLELDCKDPRAMPLEEVVLAFRVDASTHYVVAADHGCDLVVFAPTHSGSAPATVELSETLARLLHGGPAAPSS